MEGDAAPLVRLFDLIQCVLRDEAVSRRMVGMRERMELLGGTIEIDTAPGQGVRIVVNVPLLGEP